MFPILWSDYADADTSMNHRRLNVGFTVTFDILTISLLASAFLYMICFRLAKEKIVVLHRRNSNLTTTKLLLLGVATVCLLRVMTILGVATMNMANVRAHYSLQPPRHNNNDNDDDKAQAFYDTAMTVLFDLPNCMVVSTYVLLTLVWAECFLEARFHTENSRNWKRRLLISFMVFNGLLYATQLILYACVFFVQQNTIVRTILYAAITGITFTAVMLVLGFYIYLNFKFSGYPYRSQEARRSLARVSSVMTLWSFTRVVWGIATLLVYIDKIELLQDSHTPVWSFFVLFIVFFGCEIVPIFVLLDYSYYMQMIGRATRTPPQQRQQQQQQQMPPEAQRLWNGDDVVYEAESDSLLSQRPLRSMDHLLLTSARTESRRVRFHPDDNNNSTGDIENYQQQQSSATSNANQTQELSSQSQSQGGEEG